jgi:hypothetical protein
MKIMKFVNISWYHTWRLWKQLSGFHTSEHLAYCHHMGVSGNNLSHMREKWMWEGHLSREKIVIIGLPQTWFAILTTCVDDKWVHLCLWNVEKVARLWGPQHCRRGWGPGCPVPALAAGGWRRAAAAAALSPSRATVRVQRQRRGREAVPLASLSTTTPVLQVNTPSYSQK